MIENYMRGLRVMTKELVIDTNRASSRSKGDSSELVIPDKER